MKVAVAGSSGFMGSALVRALVAEGHDVVRVGRSESSDASHIRWDPARGAIDTTALEGIDAAVNLAGENIGSGRWTPSLKAQILDSRELGTKLLAETLAGLTQPPRVLVNASAIGFYGDRGDDVLTERSGSGDGYMAMVVRRWEAAAAAAEDAGIRVCYARTGLPLGREGGLLKQILLPFRLGIGGRIASGRQWMSWVALTDQIRALLHLLNDDQASGPFNIASPNAVRNRQFTEVLARVLHRPAVIPIRKALIAIRFGRELTDEFLSSIHVVPERLTERGFRFQLPDLEPALRAELRR